MQKRFLSIYIQMLKTVVYVLALIFNLLSNVFQSVIITSIFIGTQRPFRMKQ